MRIILEFYSDKKNYLPVGFNKYIQSLIYNLIDKTDSNWLHERGFQVKNRNFRLFTFSSILEKGRYIKNKKLFVFPNKISFIVSSPVDWILEQVAKNTIFNDTVYLGSNELFVSSISIVPPVTINKNEVKINALTPIEIHSTFTKPDGKKLTYYYTPFDKDFSNLINLNLKKKWEALFKKECQYNISVEPLFSTNRFERIVYYGTGDERTLIKGWKGSYMIKGEPEFLKFAYDAGLGSRNSQGFGMVEVKG